MADPQPNNDATREEMLDRVIDKVLELQRTGATISLDECVAQYPELEHELRELLPAIHMAENLRPLPLSTIRTVGSYAKSPDTLLQRNSERFKILRALDRGGLGVVSVAIDQELHREVAVKEIREDRADDQGLRAKFILEAEVTGGLEHPGIVPVYALGASEAGRPFYAMRLIRGNNFRDHIRRFHEQVKAKDVPFNGPQLRQLVRRFLVACEAIDYAHSRGVLHRDLKPSNIMVGSFGETLVVDWGLAKATGTSGVLLERASQSSTAVMERLTESELPIVPSGADDATREGTAIGTPGYAPPEQLLGRSDSIGVHSDVYGLGAILYELLTNAPPASGSLSQILEKVTKQGIPSSRSVQPLVPKPIDAICSKALSLNPSARYSTVGLFRKDVEQWLDDEPVSSYAEPWRARARRWFKQHQTLTTSLVAVGFMAILGSFLIAFLVSQSNAELRHLNSVLDRTNTELMSANLREMSSRTEAEKREKAERFERYRTNLSATISSKQVDNRPMMASSLASAPQEFRNWEWQHFQSQMEELSTIYRGGSHICPKTLKRAVIRDDHQVVIVDPDPNVPEITIEHPNSRILLVRFSPDSLKLAVALENNQVCMWDLVTRSIIGEVSTPNTITDFLFHPFEKTLLISLPYNKKFALWNLERKQPLLTDQIWGDPITDNYFDFNSSGDRYLYSGPREFVLMDMIEEKLIIQVYGVGIGFSPSGRRFLTCENNKLRIRDSTTGMVLQESDAIRGDLICTRCDWSKDESQLIAGGLFPCVSLLYWDIKNNLIRQLEGHTNSIADVEFSPDELTALSVSQDNTARLWDLKTFEEKSVLRGHRTPIRAGTISHDGRLVLTSGDEYVSRLWDAETGRSIATLQRPEKARELFFSDDDSAILCRREQLEGKTSTAIWRTKVVEYNGILRGHSNYVYDVCFSADGSRIASAAWDGTVRVWDAKTQKPQTILVPDGPETRCFRSVAFSADGRLLVAAGVHGGTGEVILWSLENHEELHRWTCQADTEDFRATFDFEGKQVLAGSTDGTVRCYATSTGVLEKSLSGHMKGGIPSRYPETCSDVIAHSDSKRWLSAGYDGNVLVWDVATDKQLAKMTGHVGEIYRIAISRDGKLAASAGRDGKVKLWDLETYQNIATLEHGSSVYAVAFGADGSRLATGAADGLIRFWDMKTKSQVAELHGHGNYVHALDFSPDGTQLVSASGDFTVRIWDTISPKNRIP